MRRLFAATAIAALTLFSVACGSDEDKDSTSTENEASDTTEEESDDTTVSAPDDNASENTDADDDSDETTAPEDTEADDDDNGDVPDLSEESATFAERFSDEFDFENLDEISDAIQELKSITPDEIDEDLDTLSGVYDDMAGLIDEAGGDPTAAFTDPEFLAALEELNTPEVQDATSNVEAFFTEACPDLDETINDS